MAADKTQVLSGMTTRQKATAIIIVVVVLIIIWQVIGLFGGGGKGTAVTPSATNKTTTTKAATSANTASMPAGGNMSPQQGSPQPSQLQTQTTGMTEQEQALIKMQEETQAKYLAALNELQMLKVARDIAEANQAIMTAKLATVASEKKIVDMLTPPAPPATPEAYAKNLVNPVVQQQTQTTQRQEGNYTVISVSQLQYQWSAVLGRQGSLYNVHVGDVLPPDGSKVTHIDKSGVVLEKEGVKTKITLVPII